MYYIDVIIPLPLNQLFTYQITEQEYLKLSLGIRVVVPFGKSKIYTGVIAKIHQNSPQKYEAKNIHAIIDKEPIVTIEQLHLWKWVSDYYLCSIGEVCKTALPNAFLLESETYITLSNNQTLDIESLSDYEYLIYEGLVNQISLKIEDVQNILSKKRVISTLYKMLDSGWILFHERMINKYKPKIVSFVSLNKIYQSDESIEKAFEIIPNARKQKEFLMNFLTLDGDLDKCIEKSELLKICGSLSALKGLVDKGVFKVIKIQEDRVKNSNQNGNDFNLNDVQKTALNDIQKCFQEKDVVLLHGITSSGKTEVYKKIIDPYLEKGQQVLFLLPEIALTVQLISRLRLYFGECLEVYHSKYSFNERIEAWKRIISHSEKSKIIVGTRSSIWLPFQNLGLIIIDEEHETSYKQFNPAPRFHTRDTAIVLANQVNAKVLLGSATPSLETYQNIKKSKYGLVTLDKRYNDILPPKIKLIDIKDAKKRKRMQGCFSNVLLEAIQETVDNNEQVILYQNRRGYAPVIECLTCGEASKCENCDVTLTHHKISNQLRCHYCGYHIAVPYKCPSCSSSEISSKGYGTEQIENQLNMLKPDISTGRLDFDTTRGKNSYEKIIKSFEEQQIRVLIGTQMITKGLDFKKVSLVGVINADNMLHFQDFRAHEHSFQTLQQVSGRSGRGKEQGRVFVQTYNPNHRIIKYFIEGDYLGMFESEMQQRNFFKYPPYNKLIKIILKHKDFNKLNEGANWLALAFRNNFELGVLGPESPSISRIKNQYIKIILIKIEPSQSLSIFKNRIIKVRDQFMSIGIYRNIRFIADVDCY